MKFDAAKAVRSIPIFSELSEEELAHLLSKSHRVRHPKGSVVFFQGDEGDELVIILKGKVQVLLLGRQGEELIFRTLGPGGFLGELALLDPSPRSATVMTVEAAELLQIKHGPFLEILQNNPNLSQKLLTHLARHVRDLTDQLNTMANFDVYGCIIRCLLRMASESGEVEESQVVLRQPVSVQELAQRIGNRRETVSRALKVLEDTQFIKRTKEGLVLTHRAIKRYWRKP